MLTTRTIKCEAHHKVEYSGFGVAVPRTGTPPSHFVDAVFPSDQGRMWIYCRIVLYDEQEKAIPSPVGEFLKTVTDK